MLALSWSFRQSCISKSCNNLLLLVRHMPLLLILKKSSHAYSPFVPYDFTFRFRKVLVHFAAHLVAIRFRYILIQLTIDLPLQASRCFKSIFAKPLLCWYVYCGICHSLCKTLATSCLSNPLDTLVG